jgi:hypothetical protein
MPSVNRFAYGLCMTEGERWDRLFRDLEAELAAAHAAEDEGELVERSRRELARVGLADRLRASRGAALAVHLGDDLSVEGALLDSGPDWMLLGRGEAVQLLVPLAAVVTVGGLSRLADHAAEGALATRLDLRYALRALVRARMRLTLWVTGGGTLSGAPARVGADFLELSPSAGDEPRGDGPAVVVPLAALRLVRSG